jgi:hypothetical protein
MMRILLAIRVKADAMPLDTTVTSNCYLLYLYSSRYIPHAYARVNSS